MILASAPSWTLPFSGLAVLAYALPAFAPRHLNDLQARRLLWLAWGLHALSLLILLMGPVRFGFAPALSVTAWLVVTAYMIETQFFPKLRACKPHASQSSRRACRSFRCRGAKAGSA